MEEEAEEQREQKRRKVFEKRKRKTRIKRSRVLENPLGGGWCVTRELGVVESESSTIIRAWAQGLQRREVSKFRQQDGGSGTFVFDTAVGILTHAETLGGNGCNARFAVFVYLLLRISACDADESNFRRHIVSPACDLGGGSWGELSSMSGGQIFNSQVSFRDRRRLVLADGALGDRLPRWISLHQGCLCEYSSAMLSCHLALAQTSMVSQSILV